MFALRRVAARAVFAYPTRQLSILRPTQSRVASLQLAKTTISRTFHQSRACLAGGEQKRPDEEREASPAEATTSDETVTTELSEAELEEMKEESVTASGLMGAAREKVEETTSAIGSTANSAGRQVRASVSNAAQTAAGWAYSSNAPASRILYVGNLFFEVTAKELEAEFEPIGEIKNVRIVSDHGGMSKGFGYVEFASQESADRAIHELNQKQFQGRRMAVQYHIPRERQGYNAAPRTERPPNKTLFIGNMSYQMSDRDLNDLFRDISNVLDVRVAIDRRTGQPRGFAHADFADIQSAQRAKEQLENKMIYGRSLRVDYGSSRVSTETSSRGS